MTVLDKVNDPKDIKGLTALELEELATNVRDAILNRVSQYPGGPYWTKSWCGRNDYCFT